MRKIQTIIIDDEPLARESISILLKTEENIEIVAECSNGAEALIAIETHQPQLVFLDVQMPEMRGFEMIESLSPSLLPIIIFVTAYDEYALQAFDAQAVDYLLKPFSDERFYQALKRAKLQLINQQAQINNKRLRRLLSEYKNKQTPASEKIIVRSGGRTIFIIPDEIDWIEATDYYVTLHLGAKKYLLRETMRELEAKLNKNQFVRIHRSSLINVKKIQELRPHRFGSYLVIMQDGVELPLSRRRRKILQSILSSAN